MKEIEELDRVVSRDIWLDYSEDEVSIIFDSDTYAGALAITVLRADRRHTRHRGAGVMSHVKNQHTMTARTSLSHPLLIATLPVGPGAIGVTFCPGKQGDSVFGAPWARDLGLDLDVIQAWGVTAVVTLVEGHELISLGVPDLGERILERGLQWHHLPIADLNAPGPGFEVAWPVVALQLRRLVADGSRVLVHCRGGLGRAGTVAASLLVELGVAPWDAVQRVRAARPNAIETAAQERYVLGYRPRSAGTAT